MQLYKYTILTNKDFFINKFKRAARLLEFKDRNKISAST